MEKIFLIIKRAVVFFIQTYQIKTSPIQYARSLGVEVGNNCKFGDIDTGTFGTEPYLITIGDHVEITSGVRFITHDGSVWVFRDKLPNIDIVKPIEVGNNVFIGMRSMILPGVSIGNNVIIGAGSVVVSNIPSNNVVAGIPARIIRDMDSYYKKISKITIDTKTMNKVDKKKFLIKKFYG